MTLAHGLRAIVHRQNCTGEGDIVMLLRDEAELEHVAQGTSNQACQYSVSRIPVYSSGNRCRQPLRVRTGHDNSIPIT